MRFRSWRMAGRACLFLGLTLSCRAQESLELSPRRVIDLARANALEVQQAQAEIEISEGELRAARTPLHNPELAVRGGPREGAPRPDLEAELSWTLEPPGQRRARTRSAEAELDARRATFDDTKQKAVAEALATYHEALHAQGLLLLAKAQLTRDEELRNLTKTRVERGDAMPLELKLIEAEVQRSQAAVANTTAGLERRLQQLMLSIGVPPGAHLLLDPAFPLPNVPDPMPSPAELSASRLDVEALRKQVHAAEARIAEQQRAALPSPTLQAGFSREEDKDIFLAGVAIPLPLVNRNRGEIARAQAEARRARLMLEAQLRTLEADYRAVYSEAVAAVKAAELIANAERLNQEALSSMVGAWQAGDRSLLEVLNVRREALAASREALDARLEAALAVTRFQYLAGGWR